VTYTFTQLIDIYLWTTHESLDGGLKGCSEFSMQWSQSVTGPQRSQYMVSKYVIPMVVFSQHCVQLQYPSENLKNYRNLMIALHALPLFGMSFQFACTDIITSLWPEAHDTLRWGGFSAETWQVLIVVAVVALDFYLTMPEASVRNMHIGTFFSVVSFLWFTEGTLAVGSKWCTYCLIFTAVYCSEPLWGPPASKMEAEQEKKALCKDA